MRLRILGSAAAEGWPAMYCRCEACTEARRRGGRNLRRRTAYAVNDDTLVDFGPDIFWQSVEFDIDLASIRQVLLTHSHNDHLSPPEFGWRARGYCATECEPLDIFGNSHALARLKREISLPPELAQLRFHQAEPGVAFTCGNLRVTPLEAQHASPEETALNYVIADGLATILIANDTGWWEDRTWELVRGFSVDLAVLECTYREVNPASRQHHLGLDSMLEMRDRLAELGVLKPEATVVTNHFSHNGHVLYEELCERLEPHGIIVGYDGLTIDL